MLQLAKHIRPNSVLVVCCDLLAKWFRIRVRAGARDCTRCMYFFSFSSSIISVVNTFVFVGLVSAQRITYEYSIMM